LKPNSINEPVIRHAESISEIMTAHNSGTKKVLLSGDESGNAITQIALGKLDKGESVEPHEHSTMKEYFYFMEGTGCYIINEIKHDLSKGSFIIIPEETVHALINTGEEPLSFFYFGIASDK